MGGTVFRSWSVKASTGVRLPTTKQRFASCVVSDAGAAFVAIAEPAFPWLDHYRGLTDWLRRSFPCVVESELAIVFDLRPIGHRRAAGRDRDA